MVLSLLNFSSSHATASFGRPSAELQALWPGSTPEQRNNVLASIERALRLDKREANEAAIAEVLSAAKLLRDEIGRADKDLARTRAFLRHLVGSLLRADRAPVDRSDVQLVSTWTTLAVMFVAILGVAGNTIYAFWWLPAHSPKTIVAMQDNLEYGLFSLGLALGLAVAQIASTVYIQLLNEDYGPKIALPGSRWLAQRFAARAARRSLSRLFAEGSVRELGIKLEYDVRVLRKAILRAWTPEQLGAACASLLEQERQPAI